MLRRSSPQRAAAVAMIGQKCQTMWYRSRRNARYSASVSPLWIIECTRGAVSIARRFASEFSTSVMKKDMNPCLC